MNAQAIALDTLRAALRWEGPGSVAVEDGSALADLAAWMVEQAGPWPDAARVTMESLIAMHRARSDSQEDWRRLRVSAVTLGDSDDLETRWAGWVAEAAAWPLAASRSGLAEIFRAVAQLCADRAAAETGWTVQDRAQAEEILGKLASGTDGAVPPREKIPALFAAADPVLEKRFKAQLDAGNAAYEVFRKAVIAWLKDRIGQNNGPAVEGDVRG